MADPSDTMGESCPGRQGGYLVIQKMSGDFILVFFLEYPYTTLGTPKSPFICPISPTEPFLIPTACCWRLKILAKGSLGPPRGPFLSNFVYVMYFPKSASGGGSVSCIFPKSHLDVARATTRGGVAEGGIFWLLTRLVFEHQGHRWATP